VKFDADRLGTGTAEWAEVTENICCGCVNNCLYCYAAHKADRLKLKTREMWHIEEFIESIIIDSYPAREGVIMFPSSHDITPFNVQEYSRVARLILEKGNRLLVVSKPRIVCIQELVSAFEVFKNQILFRFTIGTTDSESSLFWEPGAPEPQERIACLRFAKEAGFRTSVSIEPMLAGWRSAVEVINAVREQVTDTIWIGKMNKIRERVDGSSSINVKKMEKIERIQNDTEIMKLYLKYRDEPMIRWKDSIKEVVKRNR